MAPHNSTIKLNATAVRSFRNNNSGLSEGLPFNYELITGKDYIKTKKYFLNWKQRSHQHNFRPSSAVLSRDIQSNDVTTSTHSSLLRPQISSSISPLLRAGELGDPYVGALETFGELSNKFEPLWWAKCGSLDLWYPNSRLRGWFALHKLSPSHMRSTTWINCYYWSATA